MTHYPEIVAIDLDNTITKTPPSEIYTTNNIAQLKANFQNSIPRDGANEINDTPFIPLIITGRTETFRKVTTEWLKANNIWNYQDLIMTNENFFSNQYNHTNYINWKVQTFIENNVSICIDDVPEITNLSTEYGIKSFLIEENMKNTIQKVIKYLRSI